MHETIEIPQMGRITGHNVQELFECIIINLGSNITSPDLYIFTNKTINGLFWILYNSGKIKKEFIEKFRIKQSMKDSEISVYILVEECINGEVSFYLKELIKIQSDNGR